MLERCITIVQQGYNGAERHALKAVHTGRSTLGIFETIPICGQKLPSRLQGDQTGPDHTLETARCEGQICRVKLVNRLRYGRAKPDLLRQRVLHRLAA